MCKEQQWLRGKFVFASCGLVGWETKLSNCAANKIKLLLLIAATISQIEFLVGGSVKFLVASG